MPNPADANWLKGNTFTAIQSGWYLSRDDEKQLKTQATARGMLIADVEVIILQVLNEHSAVSERELVGRLNGMLQERTVSGRLTVADERAGIKEITRPPDGKLVGLKHDVADKYVVEFCTRNNVRRGGYPLRLIAFGLAGAAVVVTAIALFLFIPRTEPDADQDGLTDTEEAAIGTDPTSRDTDGDGVTDYNEARSKHSDPLLFDTDGDGLSDSEELFRGTDARKEDTDGDTWSDRYEVTRDTDPLSQDTDRDGLIDSQDPYPLRQKIDSHSSGATEEEKAQIDAYIAAANKAANANQYVTPPTLSVKASIERIQNLDPNRQYRWSAVLKLINRSQNWYFEQAAIACEKGRYRLAIVWLDRARLFNINMEAIEKQQEEICDGALLTQPRADGNADGA